jgi:Flp pilus assembly protein TadG
MPASGWRVEARILREECGSELVEFALCGSLLLTILFGLMGCSLALYSYHYCAQMAREATRYASVRGSTWTGTTCATTTTYACAATAANITSFVTSITPLGFTAANLSVATTWPGKTATGAVCNTANGTNSPGCIVTVKVTYTFSYSMPFMSQTPLTLSSTSNLIITQ